MENQGNKIIFKCKFGSHVYGTNLPTSDEDYKGIFIPSAEDLVLQRTTKHIEQNSKADNTKKNSPTDVDYEMFSIGEYLRLLCEGQTVALDMLFTPQEFVLETSPEWEFIKKYASHFIHKGTSAFVGYTKAQAAKYGVKGFRVSAIKSSIALLESFRNYQGHLSDYLPVIEEFVKETKYTGLVTGIGANGETELFLEVCDRKFNITSTVAYTLNILYKIYSKYGERAKLAENNEGIDWKALMHAVRVAREAEELLTTGRISFPRPEKDLLLNIRQGFIPYKEVEKIIEEGLIKVEDAQRASSLPDKPDYDKMKDVIFLIHLDKIMTTYAKNNND